MDELRPLVLLSLQRALLGMVTRDLRAVEVAIEDRHRHLRGTFSADLLPTDGIPDATGTTVAWFGGNGRLLEEGGDFGKAQSAYTLTIKGTNTDGTKFSVHQNGNAVFDPDSVPKLEFFKERTRCA